MAPKQTAFNVRLDEETQALVEALKEHFGIGNTPLFNLMVREVAAKHKVKPRKS